MAEKKRMANLELLRCIAMMMVVILHFLGKGNLLPDLTQEMNGSGLAAWLLESFCMVAVNVYMFISGYFLCTSSFKLSRLLQLYVQVWLYSVAFGMLGVATGVIAETTVDTHFFLTLLFPVWMEHYWFMTAYVFLYVMMPFLGCALKRMSKQQLKITVVMLLVVFSLSKSILPLRMELDQKGYDCLWYLCVFVTAAYIRRFKVPLLEKKGRGILLYLAGCLTVFIGTMALRLICLRTGRLERMAGMFMEYNHIFAFLAALGLFYAFLRLKAEGRTARIATRIAPYTLGVYLLHENLGLRYSWQRWLGADRVSGVASLFLYTFLAVICVFTAGIITDMLRKGIMKGIHMLLMRLRPYRRLMEGIERVDACFAEMSA